MRTTLLRFSSNLVFLLVFAGLAFADTSSSCIANAVKQALSSNHETLMGNRFETGRGAEKYIKVFGRRFEEELLALPPESHWVDAGAGEAKAIYEFATRANSPIQSERLTAIGLVKPPNAISDIPGRKFRYLSGKYIEEMNPEEIGSADLITDLYGAFSYTRAIDEVLRKYLRVLKKGGKAYIGFRPGKSKVNGSIGELERFFSDIAGARIQWVHYHADIGFAVIRVKKISDECLIPTLVLDDFTSSVPPRRSYRR